MLTPRDYRILENEISRIYSEVETDVIRRVCRWLTRNNGEVTDMDDWRVRKLSQTALVEADVRQLLAGKSREIQQSLLEAVEIPVNVSSERDERLLNALVSHVRNRTGEVLTVTASRLTEQRLRAVMQNARMGINLTNTNAEQASVKAFTDAVNKAYLAVVNGSDTLDDAVWKASKKLNRRGLEVATYSSGSAQTISIDSAVRRNVVTSVAQATAEQSMNVAKENGLDLVKTTEHIGARPEHFAWQGKVFSLEGKTPGYPLLSAPQESGGTGYGTAGGLCGCNCRHHFFPWVQGFEPADYGIDLSAKENKEIYDASQRQRGYERGVRSWKRTAEEAHRQGQLEEERKAYGYVREYQSKLRSLCAQYDLPREYAREKV